MSTISRRDLGLTAIGLGVAALAHSVDATAQPHVAGTPRDPFWFVNPELRAAARVMAAMPVLVSTERLHQARAQFGWRRPPLADVPFVRRVIPGSRGQPEVAVFVVNAKPGTHRGGILHIHGGGFVLQSAEDYLAMVQGVAKALGCCIVTVDYRLAPETDFRGSVEDNYAGLLWLARNSAELGIDPARIAVMGESAGGGHAALLAIAAHDRGEVPLVFQCLTYPMLDDRTGSTRQAPPPIGTLGWTASANAFGWRSFLGQAPGGAHVPAAAAPARRADLRGLPPAWIGVGSIDLFVGEDVDYARRLIEAGVATELLVVPGAFHGFEAVGDTAIGRRFVAARLEALRRALAA